MGSALSGWRGWDVCASEPGDRHVGAVAVAFLLEQPDPPTTVAHMAARLRCVTCGAAPTTIMMRRRTETETRWQPVIGREAHDMRQTVISHRASRQDGLPLDQPPAMECGLERVAWWRGMKI